MKGEKKEKKILLFSFIAGVLFAITEYVFSIFSSSQSVLMDAVYDAVELIFIALILFLTPLFYKPISEKHPYGYFQIENIFLIVKGFMLLSVTLSVSVEVIKAAIGGGHHVNEESISIFQMVLGIISIGVYFAMKHMNHAVSSPTVDVELLEWKLDIAYSFGISAAFFMATFLEKTKLAFLSPYFDQIMAVIIMFLMLPESIKVIWGAIKDIFLFPPDENTVRQIKDICTDMIVEAGLDPVFFDITRTGRHMWISIYFRIEEPMISVEKIKKLSSGVNKEVGKSFENCTCELILETEDLQKEL